MNLTSRGLQPRMSLRATSPKFQAPPSGAKASGFDAILIPDLPPPEAQAEIKIEILIKTRIKITFFITQSPYLKYNFLLRSFDLLGFQFHL